MSTSFSFEVLDDNWNSDHFPFLLSSDESNYITSEKPCFKKKWNLHKADYDAYKYALDSEFSVDCPDNSVEGKSSFFTRAVLEAASHSIPTYKGTSKKTKYCHSGMLNALTACN